MDIASRTIFSLSNGAATFVSAAINDQLVAFSIMVIVFFLFVYKKTDRAPQLFASLIIVLLLIDPLKAFLLVPRPCIDFAAKVPCPLDPSMPSGHAVVSGIFLMASVATPLFPLVLPLSLLVSLSRVYLGIHTVADIAGGLAVGAAIYALCGRVFAEYRNALML